MTKLMQTLNGEILVYLNPSECTIRLESNVKILNVEIFNLDGRLVFKRSYQRELKILSLSTEGFEPGVYYITIVSAKARYTQKIVVT